MQADNSHPSLYKHSSIRFFILITSSICLKPRKLTAPDLKYIAQLRPDFALLRIVIPGNLLLSLTLRFFYEGFV